MEPSTKVAIGMAAAVSIVESAEDLSHLSNLGAGVRSLQTLAPGRVRRRARQQAGSYCSESDARRLDELSPLH